MIPEATIEQIRQATDITQLIGEYIRLKKRGRNYVGLCPFHTEKTPSFSVSVDRQIYHCFGCGKGGNVFSFLMEHEKMSFVEAVRHLAQKANITIREDRETDFKREILDRISYANQVAVEYFQKTLVSAKYGEILEKYLRGRRRIDDESIKLFQLGLTGEEWDGLIRYAARKDLTATDLDKAGLVILSEKNKSYFDRFRQRLMIPIFNLSQKPIAFGGRTLKKGEPAKYVNSPETPLYVKGNVLFGLNYARDHIRKANRVYIVEGYFDLISLWQVGVKNVVASSGTAFTPQQARLLARFAEEVYLFFDADSAGRNAALRSVDSLYDAGLEVKVMTPPTGEDPDSTAVKFGYDKIDELTDAAMGYIDFRVQGTHISQMGTVSKEKLAKEFAVIANKIADTTRRNFFYTKAADKLSIDVPTLQKFAGGPITLRRTSLGGRANYSKAESELVSLLFNNPGSIDTIFEQISPDDFDSKGLSRLYSAIISQYRSTGVVDPGKLIDNSKDSDFVSLVSETALIQWSPDSIEQQTRQHVGMILDEKKKRIRQRLKKELAQAETAGDNATAARLLEELKAYGL